MQTVLTTYTEIPKSDVDVRDLPFALMPKPELDFDQIWPPQPQPEPTRQGKSWTLLGSVTDQQKNTMNPFNFAQSAGNSPPVPVSLPPAKPPKVIMSKFEHAEIGRQISVTKSLLIPKAVRSDARSKQRVVQTLFSCYGDPRENSIENRLVAFTLQFGFLIPNTAKEHEGRLYFPVGRVKTLVDYLRKFREVCRMGEGKEIKEFFDCLSDRTRTLHFKPRLDHETGRLIPELVVPTLFQFCMHELLTNHFKASVMTGCANCGSISVDDGRTDKKYCSDKCKQAAYRLRRAS